MSVESENEVREVEEINLSVTTTLLLERIACALEEQALLQRLSYEFMRDPEAQAAHQALLADAQAKSFNPDRQGEQLAAVNIKASQVMAEFQRQHPLGVSFAPPQRRG